MIRRKFEYLDFLLDRLELVWERFEWREKEDCIREKFR